jgi:hypothetical protein
MTYRFSRNIQSLHKPAAPQLVNPRRPVSIKHAYELPTLANFSVFSNINGRKFGQNFRNVLGEQS